MKKRVVLIVLLVAGATSAISQKVAWWRAWGTGVMIDGTPVESAHVYQSWAGDLIVDLRSVSDYVYVIRRSDSAVGIPNASKVHTLVAVAFVSEHPLHLVDLRTDKAGAVDPKLAMHSSRITFFSGKGNAIQVTRK